MTLCVCQDGHKWYVQEDPEDETWIAEFGSEKAAQDYVDSLENPEKKYTVEQVLEAAGKARNEIYSGAMSMDDFDDSEFCGMVEEILENPEEHEDEEE